MIFLPSRFVVVDDNRKHLRAITEVIESLGSPCLGLVYDSEHDLDARHFKGVRVLFLDLNLIDTSATTDDRSKFAVIAGILDRCISPSGGPFILMIWTAYDTIVEDLISYLDEPNALSPHARPLSIGGLSKDKFINLDTGKAKDVDALRSEIEAAMYKRSPFTALALWEADVLSAASTTVATLNELLPGDLLTATEREQAVGDILGRLASAAVGQPNVHVDRRAAIYAALGPILSDRVVNQQVDKDVSDVWKDAVTEGGREDVDQETAGKINRMLHLAVPESESFRATDWGAVSSFPAKWDNDVELRRRFGVTKRQLLGNEFKIGRSDGARCRIRLVRIGAACDHAQNRPGSLVYLLGVEIPCDIERKKDRGGVLRLPGAEWSSPRLVAKVGDGPFVLAVNCRYFVNVPQDEVDGLQSVYRLREQLLMHLISHANNYLSRPGVVQL